MSFMEKFRGPATSLDDQIESFAVERVPAHLRWRIPAISLVLLGNSTAMFFFSFGAQVGFQVGFPWMLAPLAYFFIGSTITGALTMRIASREGLSQNVLTRGLGFGSRGSAVTSFIYAFNYVFYFVFEGSIVSHAIANYFDIPITSFLSTVIFALVGLATLALVWRGMHAMSFLQTWGFPIFVLLLAYGLWKLGTEHDVVGSSGWDPLGDTGYAAVWGAFSLANGQMIFQGLMATDYGRFADRDIRYRGTASIMLSMLVPMFVVIFLGVLIGYTVLGELGGSNPELQAQDPGFMFIYLMGGVGVIFAVITQIRINVMNLYSGSIALANGFDTAANWRPGRPKFMFLVLVVGIAGYSLNVINHLGTFTAITGVLTNTWVFVILADYFICRRWLGLARKEDIEYRTGDVPAWNPIGLISLGVAVLIGALGIIEVYPTYYASFIAMVVGPVLHVVLTVATKGRFYGRAATSASSESPAAQA